MLEHEAQTLGFLDRVFDPGCMRSPQHIQTRKNIPYEDSILQTWRARKHKSQGT